jgi:hypothetical protein
MIRMDCILVLLPGPNYEAPLVGQLAPVLHVNICELSKRRWSCEVSRRARDMADRC